MIIFCKVWGFNDCHFGQFGTISARYISRIERVIGDLIHLRNSSKLVDGKIFAIIVLLLGAKSITLYFIWRVGGWFSKKISIWKKIEKRNEKKRSFVTFNFSCYYCSINLKRQLEHVELRPDTSNHVFRRNKFSIAQYKKQAKVARLFREM